jgi:glycosyltransferase involved in cell wall biosynthesis
MGASDNTQQIYLSFVIPSYGIEESLESTISEASKIAEGTISKPFEVIVPYTPRSDDDPEQLRSLEKSFNGRVRIIEEPRRGYGRAYLTGFENCRGEIVVTLDADLTYPLSFLPQAINEFEKRQLDFINTNRLVGHTLGAFTWSHYFGNQMLAIIMNCLYNTGFVDSQSGMWIIRREKIPLLQLDGIHWEFSAEIKVEARKRGLRCAEVAIPYRTRTEGKTTNSWKEGLKIASYLFSKKFGFINLLRRFVPPV